MKMYRMGVLASLAVTVFLTVLTGLLTANELKDDDRVATTQEAAAAMSQEAKAATAKLKTISESREAGNLAEIGRLIEAGADVNLRNSLGVTPLFMASRYGHAGVVELLLANKADVNVVRKTDGVTSLMVASQDGHTEVVDLLLANKADVNAARTDGATPLFMASVYGHAEIVKLLLAAGANVHAKASKAGKDHTPLSMAKKRGHTEVVELLNKHGVKR